MKIFLSSAETGLNHQYVLKVKEPKNLLVSFYYLRKYSELKVTNMLEAFKKQGNTLMLDSGAHTFLNEIDSQTKGRKGMAQKKMTKTTQSPTSYFEDYIKFIQKYEHYFSYIVELDIDAVVGYKTVVSWQTRLMALGIKNKLIFVFHKSIPNCLVEYERWCKDGMIVGVGSFPSPEMHNMLFKIALKYGTKVHGFAMTRNWWVKTYPWFSVDSSSWNLGQRFGLLLFFEQKTLEVKSFPVRSIKTNSKALQKFRQEIYPEISRYLKVPFSEFLNARSASHFIDICNIHAFLQQEKVLTELWKKRGIVYT